MKLVILMQKGKYNYQTEEQKEMQKFFIVLVILVLIILGVYLCSKVFIKPDVKEYEYTTGEVNNEAISVGTLFSKKDSYYVLAYDFNGNNAGNYKNYGDYYSNFSTKGIKIYYLDLSTAFNKPYYVSENSNPKATKIKDLKMLDGTLLLIKDKKINKYIEGIDNIAKELKVDNVIK